jgi:hypothetical protein
MMILASCRLVDVLHPLADLPKQLAERGIDPLPVPAQQVVLRRALRLDLRAPGASGSAASFWKQGDGWSSTASAPTASPRASLDITNRVVKLQTGFVYHYAFAMLIGVAALITYGCCVGSQPMTDWPILSIVTFLPLSARCSLLIRGDDEIARRNIRNIALLHHGRDLHRVAADLGGFDNPTTRASRWWKKANGLAAWVTYKMGVDGISMLFVILTTFLMPLCIWQAGTSPSA